MKKSEASPSLAAEVAQADKPAVAAKRASSAKPKKDEKRVEYKVKLSATEDQQLTTLRDNCRSSGVRVSKAKLLRAAVVLMNQQSSFKIEEKLQELIPLKTERKKSNK